MTELIKTSLYPGSSINILTPQQQVPINFPSDKFYLEGASKESLNKDEFFINFNPKSEIHAKRRPIRHSYIFRGTEQLMKKSDSRRMFDESL
jgi:hypothetical protein